MSNKTIIFPAPGYCGHVTYEERNANQVLLNADSAWGFCGADCDGKGFKTVTDWSRYLQVTSQTILTYPECRTLCKSHDKSFKVDYTWLIYYFAMALSHM